MKANNATKIVLIAIVILTLAMIVCLARDINIAINNVWMSYPWYLVFVFPGICFYIPLVALIVLYFVLKRNIRK